MAYKLIVAGESRSFPEDDPFHSSDDKSSTLVIAGTDAGKYYADQVNPGDFETVLIELGTECLGIHTGEYHGEEGSHVLGFARFRMGTLAPGNLVEIVCQPASRPAAIETARKVFEEAGLKTAVCGDFPGRIIDRLVRPYYNAALNRLDARLASAADMDLTLRLGLGYPKGPIELLEESGLSAHHDISLALYEALGDPAYYPGRRAQVAHARARGGNVSATA